VWAAVPRGPLTPPLSHGGEREQRAARPQYVTVIQKERTNGQRGQAVGTAGVYCLVLWLPRPRCITLSRVGICRLDRGWYVYTGSAKRNLLPRLLRHLRRRKRFHWHIDHLRAVASVQQIWVWPWSPGGECRTNRGVRHMPGASFPVKSFGASDCRCVAHLVSFPFEPVPPDRGAPFTYRVHGKATAASIRKHLVKE
jgi:Uri superfamily endonuclease